MLHVSCRFRHFGRERRSLNEFLRQQRVAVDIDQQAVNMGNARMLDPRERRHLGARRREESSPHDRIIDILQRSPLERHLDTELEIVGERNSAKSACTQRAPAYEPARHIGASRTGGYLHRPGGVFTAAAHRDARAHVIRMPAEPAPESAAQCCQERTVGVLGAAECIKCASLQHARRDLAAGQLVGGVARHDIPQKSFRGFSVAARQRKLGPCMGDVDVREGLRVRYR